MKNNKSEMKSTDEIQKSKTYKKQAEYFEKLKEWDKAEYFYKKAVDWSLKTDILMIPLSRTLFNCGKYDESLMYTEGILEVVCKNIIRFIIRLMVAGTKPSWCFDLESGLLVPAIQVCFQT